MTRSEVAGLALALLSSICLSWGFFRQHEPGNLGAGHSRSRPENGRYASAASAAMPIRGRSMRRS